MLQLAAPVAAATAEFVPKQVRWCDDELCCVPNMKGTWKACSPAWQRALWVSADCEKCGGRAQVREVWVDSRDSECPVLDSCILCAACCSLLQGPERVYLPSLEALVSVFPGNRAQSREDTVVHAWGVEWWTPKRGLSGLGGSPPHRANCNAVGF